MRLALDATPLLGRPTGVGRYVQGLVTGLTALPEPPEVVLTAFSWRGVDVPAPEGTHWAGRRLPARLLQAAWARTDLPPVELLSGRCDVFHGTNYVLPPRRRAAGVVSVHDLTFALHPETVTPQVLRYQRLVPRSLRAAQAVLTLSEATAAEVAAHYGLDRGRVFVARPGVDEAWLRTAVPTGQQRQALGLPDRYLLFVGTLEPRKNLPVLVEALRLLHRVGSCPPLLLAGPAGWGPPVDTAGLPGDAVRRLGYLEDAALRTVVAGAAALVFPSRYEGFGLPPLEALACGTPVVSSDLPVLREVTGPHADYAPPGDAAALAAAVSRVLADDGGAASRQARRAHAAGFTWQRCAQEAMHAYLAAAGSR